MTLCAEKEHLLGPEDHGKEFGFSSKGIWEALGGQLGEECPVICVDCSGLRVELGGWLGQFGEARGRICPPPVWVPWRCLRTPLCIQPGLPVSGFTDWDDTHVPELPRGSDSVELQSAYSAVQCLGMKATRGLG